MFLNSIRLLCGAIVLVILGQLTLGASIPGWQMERALSAASDEPFSHHLSLSSAQNGAHEPFSWKQMLAKEDLKRVSPYRPPSRIEIYAARQLDDALELLRGDWEHITRQRYQELSLEERRQSLKDVKTALFQERGGTVAADAQEDLIFQAHLEETAFKPFLDHVFGRPPKFGIWPVQLEHRGFLLAQLNTLTPFFETVHGVTARDPHHIYLGAWQELGPPGSDIYQYLGAFRVPNPRGYRKFRKQQLAPIARSVERIRMLGTSTMYIKFKEDKQAAEAGPSA